MLELKIATRSSKLALWQAHHVASQINSYYPDLKIKIVEINTTGDQVLDIALDKIGGKGLFVKELEHALINGQADIAVHSLKDLPARLVSGFMLAAVLPRHDARDAFVSNQFATIDMMPSGSVIGTASVRRKALIKKYFPHLVVKLLRGNVNTRLDKLDRSEYAGIILAVAGLARLGLESRIKQILDVKQFIPAIAQGALAIEVLQNRSDLVELLLPLNCYKTTIATAAERLVGSFLGASCSLPIGVHARITDETHLAIEAIILDDETGGGYHCFEDGDISNYAEIAKFCANKLIKLGAEVVLKKYQ